MKDLKVQITEAIESGKGVGYYYDDDAGDEIAYDTYKSYYPVQRVLKIILDLLQSFDSSEQSVLSNEISKKWHKIKDELDKESS